MKSAALMNEHARSVDSITSPNVELAWYARSRSLNSKSSFLGTVSIIPPKRNSEPTKAHTSARMSESIIATRARARRARCAQRTAGQPDDRVPSARLGCDEVTF